MARLPVVLVESKDPEGVWINESDFDAKRHTKYGKASRPKARTKAKAADAKAAAAKPSE